MPVAPGDGGKEASKNSDAKQVKPGTAVGVTAGGAATAAYPSAISQAPAVLCAQVEELDASRREKVAATGRSECGVLRMRVISDLGR